MDKPGVPSKSSVPLASLASAAAGAGSAVASTPPRWLASTVGVAMAELVELLAAVDTLAAEDRADVAAGDLAAFVKNQVEQIKREASRCAGVLAMPDVDEDSAAFVCRSLIGPVALLVSATQLSVRHSGSHRSALVRRVTRNIVHGCLGLLQPFLPGSTPNKTHAQAAGMLWRLCDKAATLPKDDVAACKRVLLECAKLAKASHEELTEEAAESDERMVPFLGALKGTLAAVKQVLGAVTEVSKSPAYTDADAPPPCLVLWFNTLSLQTTELNGFVVDFADAISDVDDEEVLRESIEGLFNGLAAVLDSAATGSEPVVLTPATAAALAAVGEKLTAMRAGFV